MTHAYFLLCLASGRLLRAGRYSKIDISAHRVRKRRGFYAPLLLWMGNPIMRMLDTGVRILPQRKWEERERRMYGDLYGDIVDSDGGTLILPCLAGETLASVLEDPTLDESSRKKAIERSVIALAELHRLGITHGDAMAENVMVDVEAGVARWFDFETVHSAYRSMAWRRADDVRALLTTCLVRTASAERVETIEFILNIYADERITPFLAETFTSILRRSLTFHLAQAELPFQCYRECARVLKSRLGGSVRV